MSEHGTRSATDAALRGAAAGVLASAVQAAIGKTEEKLFLPDDYEDSNIAPRLVDRLAGYLGEEPSQATEWALGTVFHLGYGAGWGALYAITRERLDVEPLVGGAALGALIYGITFPSWGGAVQTRTERPPERRTRGMELVAVSVSLGFGLSAALLYEQLRG